MRLRPILTLAGAAAALAAAAPAHAQDRRAEVERVIFELCPQALDGKLALADPAQVAAAGFTPAGTRDTPSGPNPRATRGTGAGKIVISTGTGEMPSCAVWFGGPDNAALFNGVVARAQAAGYAGGLPQQLGDGAVIHLLKRPGTPSRSLILLQGDGGGELDFQPVTTVVMMDEKGK